MSIPRTVRIIGQPFSVRTEAHPRAAFDHDDPDTFDALGYCDRSKQVISIRGPEGISMAKTRETLLHEVLHAIIGTARIPPFSTDNGHDEEAVVSMLAPLLLHTLRDNPDLVRTLLASDDVPSVKKRR